MKSNRAKLRILAGVAVTSAALVASNSTASAYAAAYNERTLMLNNAPAPGSTASVVKSIYLAAGHYDAFVEVKNSNGDMVQFSDGEIPDIYLSAGWYTWTCTIWSQNGNYYSDKCTLDNGNGAPASFWNQATFNVDPYATGYTVKSYTLSGSLTPKF